MTLLPSSANEQTGKHSPVLVLFLSAGTSELGLAWPATRPVRLYISFFFFLSPGSVNQFAGLVAPSRSQRFSSSRRRSLKRTHGLSSRLPSLARASGGTADGSATKTIAFPLAPRAVVFVRPVGAPEVARLLRPCFCEAHFTDGCGGICCRPGLKRRHLNVAWACLPNDVVGEVSLLFNLITEAFLRLPLP